ncbi:type IV secretory system conjugative DNA transfer family protein [Actinospica robiniae]|uniref:type IV secretory system conjugative DNA transfer family protein n=1 Tax=Actinospica robiniae TaxID=304901 RepID=UPI0004122EB1|nr:type IV secretion system DNA-binding domain-containing protein [Actinospica robiniae]
MGYLPPFLASAFLFAEWNWPQLISLLGLAAAYGAIGARKLRRRRQRAFAEGARVLEIACPPESGPAGATTLWGNLLGLHRPRWRRLISGQPHVSFEYAFTGRDLAVRMWVPGTVPPDFVERAVEAAWPGARATGLDLPVSPLLPAGPRGAVSGGRLVLARGEALPLAVKHEADPLRPLIGAGTALNTSQGACLQILARPASASRCARTRRRLRTLEGKRATTGPGLVFDVYRRPGDFMDSRLHADARAAAGKLAGSLYEVEIRYAAACPAKTETAAHGRRRMHRDTDPVAAAAARGICHAIASASGVFADRNHLRRRRLRDPARIIAARQMIRGQLCSIPELAALAHLPWDANTPGLTRAGARPVPPATRILTGSGSGSTPAKILGDADAGPARPIALGIADARAHLHVMGKTGSGKSTLLAQMILQDAAAGRGTVVIDPKGDLITDLLDRLPQSALYRPIVLFDPTDSRLRPPRVNMLDGAEPDLAVDHLVGIFSKLYASYWGPRTDDLLRAACLTLIHASAHGHDLPTPTLAAVPDLLSVAPLRRRYVKQLPSEYGVLHGFWTWYGQLSDPARASITAPLLNKLRSFLLRDYPARVVGSGPTDLDLGSILDGGILLARLPKGVLGEDGARLLGSFLVAKTWQAAAARAGSLGAQRKDASMVIDEAHNFLTLPIGVEDMLAEARGYRLSLTLAHQDLAQLPAGMREAISANARNKIYFNASPEDAARLARHTSPHLTEHDLAHLGAFQAATRLAVDASEQPACTLVTRPLGPSIPGRADQARVRAAATQDTGSATPGGMSSEVQG